MSEQLFYCHRCGECCKNFKYSTLYADLDDGTGKCKYFDEVGKLCSIYESRPEKCNVIAMYKYFEDAIEFADYVELNKKSCEILRGL